MGGQVSDEVPLTTEVQRPGREAAERGRDMRSLPGFLC